MIKSSIFGFIAGLIVPFILVGFGLQADGILGFIAQDIVEFSYIITLLFDEPFGNLGLGQKVATILSSGLIWALVFMAIHYLNSRRKR